MFKWATVAKRPLHIEEFKEAVAFDPSDKSWNEDKIPHEDRMFESCRGLIIRDTEDQTVRFAHHTILQYLTSGLSTIVDSFFEITTVGAETFAGQVCVGYLLFSDFETQLTTAPLNLGTQGVLQSGGPLKIPETLDIKAPIALPYRLIRGKVSSRAPQMDYSKHLNSRFESRKNSSVAPSDKYRLLQYVIDYWETHVRSFATSSASAELYSPLSRLALQKTLAFDFRPWGPNQHHGPHGCVGCPNPNTTDLDATDLPNISMLHYAVEVGNVPLLLLLQNPLVSQTRDISEYFHHERYHDETLLIACRHGRIEIVKYLMSLRPFNITDGRAVSAAATAGHADVLQYLIRFDRSWIGQQGEDILLAAVRSGHEDVIGVLVEAGVSLEATDKQTGRGVLELAAIDGHYSMVRNLFKIGARTQPSSDFNLDQTALYCAAMNNQTAAVRALLESIPWPDDIMNSVLHVAARSGHNDVAEVLLEYGIDSASKTLLDMNTAFLLAAENGHIRILDILKDHVQSVDSPRTVNKQTALHVAAIACEAKVVRWLRDKGADVDKFDLDGGTPLNYATRSGDESVVRILLEHGASVVNLGAESDFRLNSLLDAVRLPNTTILELLLKSMREGQFESVILWGADYSQPMKRAAIVDALREVRKEQMLESAGCILLEQELELYPEWKPFF